MIFMAYFYCFDDDFIIILNVYKDQELSKQNIIIKSYLKTQRIIVNIF